MKDMIVVKKEISKILDELNATDVERGRVKEELQRQLDLCKDEILSKTIQEMKETIKRGNGWTGLITTLITKTIKTELDKRDANRINYASSDLGATVAEKFTTPFYSSFFSCFGLSTKGLSGMAALNPNTEVSNCWSFRGSSGHICVILSQPIIVKSMIITHVPWRSSPNEGRSSPKDFSFFSFADDENLQAFHSTKILDGVYEVNSTPSQVFVCPSNAQFSYAIMLKIYNNNGENRFTCLYHMAVHGFSLNL